MSDRPPRSLVPKDGGGVFHDLALRIKLILRLMGDRRVNPLLKLLPLGAVAYWLIPDMVPGPIDDAAVLWLGSYLFVELCPPPVVHEHMQALTSVVEGQWREVEPEAPREEDKPTGGP